MSELKTLVAELIRSETTTQLSSVVQHISKCILQELLAAQSSATSGGNEDYCPPAVLEAFRAIAKKSVPTEVVYKTSASGGKAQASRALIIFDNMRQLLLRMDSQKLSLPKPVVTELLFVIVGHNRPSLEWSSSEIHRNQCKLIELVVKITETKTIGELLNEKYNHYIIRSLLAKVRTNCPVDGDGGDNEWPSVACNSVIFEWIVTNISAVDRYLHDVFAPTVQLIDDHMIHNKVCGVKCLHIIVRNCWPELRLNGSDLLIFERAKTLLYNKEPELFEVLFDCVLDVMNKFDSYDRQEAADTRPLVAITRNDQIALQVMQNIRMSSDTGYRVMHLRFLDKFFVTMNSAAQKHSVSYVTLLCDLLSSEPICLKTFRLVEVTINSLNAFLICVWITIHEFLDKCLLCLLKLSVNSSASDLSPELKHKLNQRICDSIHIIRNADKTSTFKVLAESLMKSPTKTALNEFILNLFTF